MAALSRPRQKRPFFKTTALWFERLVALVALCNLLIVLFDLSYIRFRDIYLRYLPELTHWYGETYKGIEPERSTISYLETVDRLEEQVAQTGLQSIQAQTLLAELRDRSDALIDENPFQIADKSGTLERIKNMMRDRVGVESAKQAFDRFWSRDYLSEAGWSQEIAYFNSQVQPLMETNYFRNIGENGAPQDDFWRLDSGFVLFFTIELLLRTLYISRRYQNYTWLDAILMRWYDLLLLLPFWRWLRVVPTTIRLNQSQLVNLVPLRNRVNRIFVTTFAVELTEVVLLRIIDQMQNLIRDGDVARWLLTSGAGRYIDINGINEVEAIAGRLTTVLMYRVLPQIKPELDALLHHSVSQAFSQAPGYQGFRQIPGIGGLPDQIAQQVVSRTSQNLYEALTGALEDEKGSALMRQLLDKLGDSLRAEIQQEQTVEDLQDWTVALLEEVKLNYVRKLSTEDIDRLLEENYKIYNLTQARPS